MLRLLVFILCATGTLTATCTLKYNPNDPGVFTRKFGSNILVIPGSGSSLSFDSSLTITAYCPAGFTGYANYETQLLPEIIYTCSGTTLNYRRPGSSTWATALNTGSLSCSSAYLYYEANVKGCTGYGLAFGFFLAKQPVILAAVCFDLNAMKTNYVQYVAGPRTAIVESQKYFNPPNITFDRDQPIDVFFDTSDVTAENEALQSAVLAAMPNFADIVLYKLDELVSFKSSVEIFGINSNQFKDRNMIAWWQPLRLGNWKGVEHLIAEVSANMAYEVYAGTSGVVTYPVDGFAFTDRLTYKHKQYVRNVPLYVWNFVRQKDNSKDDGVVIVGINSPFFKVNNSSEELCDDICDSVPWLNGISRLRKFPTLGYVFCCHPKDVAGKLENFPLPWERSIDYEVKHITQIKTTDGLVEF